QDVARQKGFITADIEYVTDRSPRYSEGTYTYNNATIDYSGVNDAIKYSYKGNLNFKVGGEMKFNTFMGRLGFAYSTSPYQQGVLKANKMFISGGIGYRNKGMFIDLAYVQSFINDVNFPYHLSDKANTFATLKNSGGTLLATIGFKF
ncbi:MAG: aromatic hydrocarbon degradation protein, partial [Bacteroidetes bacterium]|nr:aromatic hydrocarbon degradation protein [Bacteroidota bacterium]